MSDGESFLSATLRWLGAAADFAASVCGGAPIGITTDVATPPPLSGDEPATEREPEDDDGSAT